MAPLSEQLLSLRTPAELRNTSGKDLDAHITKVILKELNRTKPKELAAGDDKTHSDLLESLSPQLDTLPYLFTLNAQIGAGTHKGQVPGDLAPGGGLWRRAQDFITSFDAMEIRYAGGQWQDLLVSIAGIRPQAANMIQAPLQLLALAMSRLDPSLGTYTSSHLLFVNACLATHSFAEALPIIEHEIHSFPPKQAPAGTFPCSNHYLSNGYLTTKSNLTDAITIQDVQEYQLLSAMVYIGLKKWPEAQYHLDLVLSTPTTNTANALMMEAYRKWLLVSLLVDGNVGSAPKTASSGAMKTIRAMVKPYDAIVEAFKRTDPAKLSAEVYEYQRGFDDDGNYGLLQCVIAHHRNLYVLRFVDLYAAVPITKLATELNQTVAEAEKYIGDLIAEGLLPAEIEAPTGDKPSIVKFVQPTSSLDVASESRLRDQLLSQAKRIQALDVYVAEADHRLAVTKEYAEHVRRARKEKADREQHGNGEKQQDAIDLMGVGAVPFGEEEGMVIDQRGEL